MNTLLANKHVSSCIKTSICVFCVSILCTIAGFILFANNERTSFFVDVLDGMKTTYRFSVSLPLFFCLNIIAVVICFPLSPHQLICGYCLGSGIGATVNVVATFIGILICLIINKFTKIIHNFVSRIHPNYRRWAEQEGFFFVFLNVFSPKLTVGTSVFLISKSHCISNLIATIIASVILSIFYGYTGSLIDPFVVFLHDINNFSILIQLVVVLLIAVISFSGTMYWSRSIRSSRGCCRKNKNKIEEEKKGVLPKKATSFVDCLKQIFFEAEDDSSMPRANSEVSSVDGLTTTAIFQVETDMTSEGV